MARFLRQTASISGQKVPDGGRWTLDGPVRSTVNGPPSRGFGMYATVNPSGSLRNKICTPTGPETRRTTSQPNPSFSSPHSAVWRTCTSGYFAKYSRHSSNETTVTRPSLTRHSFLIYFFLFTFSSLTPHRLHLPAEASPGWLHPGWFHPAG